MCACVPLAVKKTKASTGYGADQAGNGYGGDPNLTLEEAVDLAESEVQSIVSLVNVLYTDQVSAALTNPSILEEELTLKYFCFDYR